MKISARGKYINNGDVIEYSLLKPILDKEN